MSSFKSNENEDVSYYVVSANKASSVTRQRKPEETVKQIEAKFQFVSSMGWGNESLFNGPGHMTNMAAMPIYGKSP